MQMTPAGKPTYKVVLLGDGGVGKSAVTLQYTNHEFTAEYDPTIEDAYKVDSVVDGEQVLLDILDTAGQEVFSAVREQYIRDGEGFLLVFSITSRASYQSIDAMMKQIERLKDVDGRIPAILLGNKCDLDSEREVSTDEGHELAGRYRCPYLESSALKMININEAFAEVVRAIKVARAAKAAQDEIRLAQERKGSCCCTVL